MKKQPSPLQNVPAPKGKSDLVWLGVISLGLALSWSYPHFGSTLWWNGAVTGATVGVWACAFLIRRFSR